MQHLQSEFNSLMGDTNHPIERRDFIKAAIGIGFATAALPICAKTAIHTDPDGLTEGKFNLTIDGQIVPVYMAQPKDKTNLPVVIVVSEIFGLHEHIADVVRRFAKRGYLALAPDLFVRQGNPAKYDNIATVIKEVISKVPDQQVMKDLDACVDWAKHNGGNASKMAVVGFCWGGRIVWLYSAHNPQIKAGVAWYGRLASDTAPTPLNPQNPLDIATKLTTPVLGLYGGKDTGISMAAVQQMKDALAKGNKQSSIVVYPQAGHAFYADYRPSYVAGDAKDSWNRCIQWLHGHGVK